jgi:hypothetical protein
MKNRLSHLALVSATAALTCAFGLGSAAHAGVVSLIQFGQTSSSNTVIGTQTGGSTTITISDADANISQILGGSPVNGVFVDLLATSDGGATTTAGITTQHFSGTFCVTSAAGCGGTNYLSGTFTDAAVGIGPALVLFVGSPPDPLSFTSDVIMPDGLGAPGALGFTFTGVTPPVQVVDGTIGSFRASFSGNASASAVPELSTWAMLGLGFAGLGFAGFRSSRKTSISVA